MAKKKPVPTKEPDLLQQLREEIERARRNNDTWKKLDGLEKMDGGKITPMELAIAMVLWPLHKCLRQRAGLESPSAAKEALGAELWAAVEKIKHERIICELEGLVTRANDKGGALFISRRDYRIESVLSIESPKRPDGICNDCRRQVGADAVSCASCQVWDKWWQAIEEVRLKRTRLRTKLESVLRKHGVPFEYLDRIAPLSGKAAEFHELATRVKAAKRVRDECVRNLKVVTDLQSALQKSDALRAVFLRNDDFPNDLFEKIQLIRVDLETEIATTNEPTAARQFVLQFLSIQHTPGAPVTAVGRQRDYVVDGLFNIWVEWIGKAPAANPSAGEKTPFVKLLEDIFIALERECWVTGLEKAAVRVRRKRLTK